MESSLGAACAVHFLYGNKAHGDQFELTQIACEMYIKGVVLCCVLLG